MNSFSKTDSPCDCGWLSYVINNPRSGVVYDPQQNQITMAEGAIMYHCSFCGGRFPDSSKPMWVPLISSGERERLESIIANLNTADAILRELGKPNIDEMTYTFTGDPKNPGRDESMPSVRNIEYYGLSEWLNVEFYVHEPLSPRTIEDA